MGFYFDDNFDVFKMVNFIKCNCFRCNWFVMCRGRYISIKKKMDVIKNGNGSN